MAATDFNFTLLTNFAAQISEVREKERITRELTHSEFNIFRVLGVVGYEIPTSRFISHLLDPRGDHGCAEAFLHNFLETLFEHEPRPEGNCEEATLRLERVKGLLGEPSCTVYREYKIKEGRSIDIVLEFPDFRIGIENKIDAHEQPYQVRDYATSLGDSGIILYLTKFGSNSETHEGEPYALLSYEKHIRAWLDRCLQQKRGVPRVFENLIQFRDSIDYFLNPNFGPTMPDITEFITNNPDLLKGQVDIVRSLEAAKIKVVRKFFELLDRTLATDGIRIEERSLASSNGYLNFRVKADALQPIRAYPLTIEQEGHALGDEGQARLFLGFRPSLEKSVGDEAERSYLNGFLEHLRDSHRDLVTGEHSNWPASWIVLHEAPFTPERCGSDLENDLQGDIMEIAKKIQNYVEVFSDWKKGRPFVRENAP